MRRSHWPVPAWRADVVAGLSVIGLLIPEAVAYAQIAGLPARTGLVALFCGLVCYGLIGSSRFAIASSTSSAAVVLAAALAALVPTADMAGKTVVATLLVGGAGLLFAVAALFDLGKVSAFIAKPVLRGVTIGLAVYISVSQLPKLLGVPLQEPRLWAKLWRLLQAFADWHWPSLLLGALALVVLFAWRSRRQPVALWVVVGSVVLAQVFDLPQHGIATVGAIHLATPLRDWSVLATIDWFQLAQMSLALVLIVYAESYSAIRSHALQHGDVMRPNRDLAALGLVNTVSALGGGLAVGAGFSGTAANVAAGAQSKWAAWFAAMILLLALWWLLPQIALIPEPVLAAVVIHAVSHGLDFHPVRVYFHWRRDRLIVVSTIAAVMAFGVLNGLLVAVVLSLVMTLGRLSQPTVSVLGRLADGHDFVNIEHYPHALTQTGILVVRVDQPLFFANAEQVAAQIEALVAIQPHPLRAVVFSLNETPSLDGTAIETLADLAKHLRQKHISLQLCRLRSAVYQVLVRAAIPALPADHLSDLSVDHMVNQLSQTVQAA